MTTKKLNKTRAQKQLTRGARNWRVWDIDEHEIMTTGSYEFWDTRIKPWIESYKAVRPDKRYDVRVEKLDCWDNYKLRVRVEMVDIDENAKTPPA